MRKWFRDCCGFSGNFWHLRMGLINNMPLTKTGAQEMLQRQHIPKESPRGEESALDKTKINPNYDNYRFNRVDFILKTQITI